MKREEKMMTKVLFWIGLLFLFCWPISSNGVMVDRIIAVVNQEIITLSEVEKLIGSSQEEIKTQDRLERREKVNEVFRKGLEILIEEKLIDQEVKKIGIKVTGKEVEGAIEDIKRRNALTQEDFERALAKEGLTLEALKKQIEKRIQRMKFIRWAVNIEPKIAEEELRDFYEKNMERYFVSESFRPAQILFVLPKDATPQEVLEIKRKCQKVLEKIKGGEDFGEMALLYSEDASSKDRGDLGYFKKGELLPALEKEVLRLQVGEVSGIIRTDFGFHLIKLLDRKGGSPSPFEEVKEKVWQDCYEEETQKSLRQFISTLKEKAVIEIKL
jgi:parvulin-like peptidyl-prolyl isomerase